MHAASAYLWGMSELTISFDSVGVDLDRLERCLQLQASRTGAGRYHVAGGEQAHWVDLYTTGIPRCDCGDHLWRDQICKHILAALLREGDERVLGALRALVDTLRNRPIAA
jgi:SWIM zinc finger